MERKRKEQSAAEKKAGDFKKKEADKRLAAARARAAAARFSGSSAASKLREATRHEDDANKALKEAAQWQQKAATLGKDSADLEVRLAKALATEGLAAERKRAQELQLAERRAAMQRAEMTRRLEQTESIVEGVLVHVPAPKPEKLRGLLLGASSEGELRVAREQARIRSVVERANHRDLIQMDARASATAVDLLDGILRFRPHVVHFSGHGDEDGALFFEEDTDIAPKDTAVTPRVFAAAMAATDTPPILVLLNACDSAVQIGDLVRDIVPFAIGMSDEIMDGDAITYAANFYAAVANGHSIRSAHAAGQVALELAGLTGAKLPVLACAAGLDPAAAILVKPAE
ncbi:CHAT domain-containing protein [Phytomonospora endophytica]|nr:CHAT domain-containing protein [Phytomonospora endophytica]